MAHYDLFRHHLAIKFPAYGYALWDPDHGNLYPPVEVGDVGYIGEGKFHRLFNVLLPADHPSQSSDVPEYHEQLTLDRTHHISSCQLSPNNFCSAKVTSKPESEWMSNGPEEIPKVSFSCPMKEGAVLSLPIQAKGRDTVAKIKFGKWLVKHIDRWFAWARQLEFGVDRMEDIILVTGTHRTRSWTNAAFPGGQKGAQASFGAKAGQRGGGVAINWQFSHEHNRGVVLNRGPEGVNLPEDQCIFIRGFRAARRFKILPPKLKAAAGPNPDPEEYDEGSDVKLTPISALPEYRDPLHILIEYIAEAAPNDCSMILVHDDDLERFYGIYDSNTPLDYLRQDVVLSNIRSLKPTLGFTLTWGGIEGRSSTGSSASADTEPVWVAALSTVFENRCYPDLAHVSLPTPTQGNPAFLESPPAGRSVQRDHSAGQPATLSPPPQTFEPTQDLIRTPDPGQQSTSVPFVRGGDIRLRGPTQGLPHTRRLRPTFFDLNFNEFEEWRSPQHIQEGVA